MTRGSQSGSNRPGRPSASLMGAFVYFAVVTVCPGADPDGAGRDALDIEFAERVQPFVQEFCQSCHGAEEQEAKLDLSNFTSVAHVVTNYKVWEVIRDRLEAGEMPPGDAPAQPEPEERQAVIDWINDLEEFEAASNAGDPGLVLARRLSNAEYNYSIRDLTGVDIQPTREFPVDPANEAGFDNSGESLAMSPALLGKYLAAARSVADHIVFLPQGFTFAPHAVVTDTDRDKYCVLRIVDFYNQHPVDLADYFHAAWRFEHRAAFGRFDDTLDAFADDSGLSGRYLARVWTLLTGADGDAGPVELLRTKWRALPDHQRSADARAGCERLRDLVLQLRGELQTQIETIEVAGISNGSQPLVLWHNQQRASSRLLYTGDVTADSEILQDIVENIAPDSAFLFTVDASDADSVSRMREAFELFCGTFPDTFCVVQRGPYFAPTEQSQQRLLTAGFHLMQGYFRDDQPLYELILDDAARQKLDALWEELDFITDVPARQYKDFIFFERAEPPRFMGEAEFDFARSEDKDAASSEKMALLRDAYVAKAIRNGASDQAQQAIRSYFTDMSAGIRRVAESRVAAETSHLAALVDFARRAWRRPLEADEHDQLIGFYHSLRDDDGLSHEEAVRDALASVLMSPYFCYRFELAAPETEVRPLNDYELASRLSYFLWASIPDDELLAHAAAGDLHQPAVLAAQAQRMLGDPRVRGLTTEFLGNLLDIRRFEQHNAVDREQFPTFTGELRQAMFEEPLQFFDDVCQNDRSILDLIDGRHTFVNRELAALYGMPLPGSADEWVRVDDADQYGRGGLLPMAVFLTRNSPGLRTSPVKRGYWVVRRLLDEYIPPPPPTVPELPDDEAGLGDFTLAQTLARHRADESCAACHNRFDSIGLVFEGFGPIGERRALDLGGRPVATRATFPDGRERDGVDGLRDYLREQRQADFVDCFASKLLSYALGRTLLPSDGPILDEMQTRLAADGYTLGSLVESIVTSPQFLRKRGGATP